jgi:hypothetical protein
MNDAEWEAWQASWNRAEGPLPDVRACANRQASRHRRANGIFFTIIAAGMIGDAWAAIVKQADPIVGWGLVVWGAAVIAIVVWLQRGSRLGDTATPREALGYLEDRLRIEQRGARILRWVYAVAIVAVAVYHRDLFGDDWQVKLIARALMAVMFALTLSAPWWMRRFAARQHAELALWRRWIDEQQL